jgi:GNAT superfamily N-acetyltransferase
MDLTIRKLNPGETSLAKQFNRKSRVESRLALGMENEKLTHTITPVESLYEREVQLEDTDYGFTDEPPTVFVAEVDGKLAGRIRLLKWWNQFGYIEDLVVNPEFRGLDLGRKLIEQGIQWARDKKYPGMMLETQDDNVPACQLYAFCGFVLSGFDRNVYKATNPNKRETALYWYLLF